MRAIGPAHPLTTSVFVIARHLSIAQLFTRRQRGVRARSVHHALGVVLRVHARAQVRRALLAFELNHAWLAHPEAMRVVELEDVAHVALLAQALDAIEELVAAIAAGADG